MNKSIEKFILVAYFMLVAFTSAAFNFSYLFSTLLFFAIPSLYVTLKHPELFRTLATYAIAIGVPFVLIIDAIGVYNHAWWETSIFSQRIFGLVPFDTVLWAILYSYAITALYEYFFAQRKAVVLSKNFWKFETGLLGALVIFLASFSFHREWFTVQYFYTVFVGVFYVLISLIGLVHKPAKFSRLWTQCLFFSILLLIGELGALAANHWGFSGSQYLGMIHIANLSFPFEEMIWILTGVPAFLYAYLQLTDASETRTEI